MKKSIVDSKLIVLKLGTNVVIKNGKFNSVLVKDLAKDIAHFNSVGKRFVLISSGAIGLGKQRLSLNGKNLNVAEQQACASVGQSLLMKEYEKIFSKQKIAIAQVLLTQENFEKQNSLENFKNTLNELLKLKVIPIINENDAVSIEELSLKKHFSDNDVLSALVAKHLKADLLLILTNVEGLYSCDPSNSKKAKLIEEVHDLKKLKISIGKKSFLGRGGIETKLKAVEIALNAGANAIICCGKKNVLKKIFSGKKIGTRFY